MEPITQKNGALVVVPGSHKLGLLPHETPKWFGGVNLAFEGVADYKEFAARRQHLIMDPGDCVLFHPTLVHGSGANQTTGFRRAISAHYAPNEATWIDSSNSSEPIFKIDAQVMEKIKKKFSDKEEEVNSDEEPHVDYFSTMWKFRGRLVRGEGGWEI